MYFTHTLSYAPKNDRARTFQIQKCLKFHYSPFLGPSFNVNVLKLYYFDRCFNVFYSQPTLSDS